MSPCIRYDRTNMTLCKQPVCNKAKCMEKGVTKIAFLQSNNMAVNPSMFYE